MVNIGDKWWRTIDVMKYCRYCGDNVNHGHGWSTVGMCKLHQEMWEEDIRGGFKQNRLKEISIAHDSK